MPGPPDPGVAALRVEEGLDTAHAVAAPDHTAVDVTAAGGALDALNARWVTRNPAIVRLWRGRWEQFVPFPAFPSRSAGSSLPQP